MQALTRIFISNNQIGSTGVLSKAVMSEDGAGMGIF